MGFQSDLSPAAQHVTPTEKLLGSVSTLPSICLSGENKGAKDQQGLNPLTCWGASRLVLEQVGVSHDAAPCWYKSTSVYPLSPFSSTLSSFVLESRLQSSFDLSVMADQAFVTLATNDNYARGAMVLGKSLRNHNTSKKLVALIGPQMSEPCKAVLKRIYDEVREVDVLDSGDTAHLAMMKRPDLGVTFTKLHCWTLTHYSKEELSAAPDPGWPDCFNSGVFVFRPSLETYGKLLQHCTDHGSFDGERRPGVLNSFFNDWSTADISKHLPFIYNLSSIAIYTYLPAFKQYGGNAKVVHFLGKTKPWSYTYDTKSRRITGSAHDATTHPTFLLDWWSLYSRTVVPMLQEQHGDQPFYSGCVEMAPLPVLRAALLVSFSVLLTVLLGFGLPALLNTGTRVLGLPESSVTECIVGLYLLFVLYMATPRIPRGLVEVKGRAVFVTGCDSGFGLALSKHLHKLGFTVYAGCLLKDEGGEGAKELEEFHSDRMKVVQLDVCSEEQVSEVNLWGSIRVTKAVLPLIRKAKGRVVNISSMMGRMGVALSSPYCISKYGVEAFSDCLRYEMKTWGVKVSIVEPGNFVAATGIMTRESMANTASKLWSEAPAHVQEDYGKARFETLMAHVRSNSNSGQKDISPVLEDITDAIMSKRPYTRYHPMEPHWWIRVQLMTHLPAAMSDFLYF
ncbi:hypothetical protein F7725_029146 [Dissostichus mawsoni]|uniref:Uncharacterized protein n=1 Tax=Dissostichus mawsoni TaxID=36200 RepID=A0A7J5XK68_DISMA|nr:hypothetical protein F7725_029146 [Dissostichus mawsoni]